MKFTFQQVQGRNSTHLQLRLAHGTNRQLKPRCWSEAKEKKQEGWEEAHLEGSRLAKGDFCGWGVFRLRFWHLLVQYFNLIGEGSFA